jgi:hypothetical protein
VAGVSDYAIALDPREGIFEVWSDVKNMRIPSAAFLVGLAPLRYAGVARGRRPLSDLRRRLERLENGNLGVRVSERAVPELARINRHFDHMVDVLGTP